MFVAPILKMCWPEKLAIRFTILSVFGGGFGVWEVTGRFKVYRLTSKGIVTESHLSAILEPAYSGLRILAI